MMGSVMKRLMDDGILKQNERPTEDVGNESGSATQK
jgi:hypothetical protein